MKKYKRRVLSWLLTIVMVCSYVDPAMAAGLQTPVDEHDHVHTEELRLAAPETPVDEDALNTECYVKGDLDGDGQVASSDAIYLLLHKVSPRLYPVNQNCDFNADGSVDNKDAYKLLHHFFWNDDATLGTTVHVYPTAQWTWSNENTASAEARCQCGAGTAIVGEDSTPIMRQISAVGCLDAGVVEYTATVTLSNGKTYTDTKQVVTEATGHRFETVTGADKCTRALPCLNECGYTKPAKGHEYEKNVARSTAATCTAGAVDVYVCKTCDAEYSETVSAPAEHTIDLEAPTGRKAIDAARCLYQKTYTCSVCGTDNIAMGETFADHSYALSVTPATCNATGLKTYTCSVCGSVKEQEEADVIPVDTEAHDWVNDTCTRCGKTRRVVSVTETNEVSVAALQTTSTNEVVEVALDAAGTTIQLDDTVVEQLGDAEKVEIKAEAKSADDLPALSENAEEAAELKSQIGGKPVYDFSMKVGDNNVDFNGGEVTVSLPYTLAPGEDPDAIDIWYIADNGEIDTMRGTYNNGFVTFKTKHFSLYAVVALTPAQRCERYGHLDVSVTVPATCETAAYTLSVCARCARVSQAQTGEALGHDYHVTSGTAATCTTEGRQISECSRCRKQYEKVSPALGHLWKVNAAKSESVSCTTAGKTVYSCDRDGCTADDYEEELPATGHSVVEGTPVAATCTEEGYTPLACRNTGCDFVYRINVKPALGHAFSEGSWNWVKEGDVYTATVGLVCDNDGCQYKASPLLKEAVVEEVRSQDKTCVVDGEAEYKATLSYNNVVYTNTKLDKDIAIGHVYPTTWTKTAEGHSKNCINCDEESGKRSEPHAYGAKTVLKAATCVGEGQYAQKCEVCGYQVYGTIPATGVHNFVNRVCTVCGAKDGCDHELTVQTVYKLADYGYCGGELIVDSCECGEYKYADWGAFECNLVWDTPVGHDAELDADIFECAVCHQKFILALDAIDKKEDCSCIDYGRFVLFNKAGEVAEKIVYRTPSFSHDVKLDSVEFFDAKDCEKGFTFTATCIKCGATETGECHNHGFFVTEVHDYADSTYCFDAIRDVACACGKYVARDYLGDGRCMWDHYDGEADLDETFCVKCKSKMTIKHEVLEQNGCEASVKTTETYYNPDGSVLYTEVYQHEAPRHTKVETPVLLGKYCTDGVKVTETCSVCGETLCEYVQNDDHYYYEERVDLSSLGMCATVAHKTTCLCGAEGGLWTSAGDDSSKDCNFDWEHSERDDETASNIVTCTECGAVLTWHEDESAAADCMQSVALKAVFAHNGKSITIEHAYTRAAHAWNAAVIQGTVDNCEDGFEYSQTCSECGYTETRYEENHRELTLEVVADLTGFEACTRRIVKLGCACGDRETWYDFEGGHCDFMWKAGDIDKDSGALEQCNNCQITRNIKRIPFGEKFDGCKQNYHMEGSYFRLVSELGPIRFRYDDWNYNHDMKTPTINLVDSTDCTKGYTRVYECSVCGGREEEIVPPSDIKRHELYAVESTAVDLTGLHGCGKEFVYLECPCGQRSSYGMRIDANYYTDCDWEWMSALSSENVEVSRCRRCGTYRFVDIVNRVQKPNQKCTYDETVDIHYVSADESTTINIPRFTYTWHEDTYCGASIIEVEGQVLPSICLNGYNLVRYCSECGQGDRWWEVRNHHEIVLDTIDLGAMGYCDTQLWKRGCACGETGVCWDEIGGDRCYWQWIGNDSADPDVNIERCTRCGNIRKYKHTFAEDGSCKATFMMVYGEGANAKTVSWSTNRENHAFDDRGYCRYCGQFDSSNCNHENKREQRIGLAQYGYCGGELVIATCACGAETDAWIDGNNCRLDRHIATNGDGIGFDECGICHKQIGQRDNFIPNEGETCIGHKDNDIVIFKQGNIQTAAYEDTISVHINGRCEEHDMQATSSGITFDNPNIRDCSEGYTVTGTCAKCGKTISEHNEWHNRFLLNQVDIDLHKAYGLCEGTRLMKSTCACGEEIDRGLSFSENSCRFDSEEWSEALRANIRICSKCGMGFAEWNENIGEKYPNCYVNKLATFEFYRFNPEAADGQGRFTFVGRESYEYLDYDHNYQVIGCRLLGQYEEGETGSCEDGFVSTGKCLDCGVPMEFEAHCHDQNARRTVYNLEDYSLCGGKVVYYSCACGRDQWINTEEIGARCKWERVPSAAPNSDLYQCSVCHNTYEESVYFGTVQPDNTRTVTRYLNLRDEDNMILASIMTSRVEEVNCNHNTWRFVEGINLNDYGFCGGGFIDVYTCDCEEARELRWQNTRCSWGYEATIGIDGHTVRVERCDNCGARLGRFEEFTPSVDATDSPCYGTIEQMYVILDDDYDVMRKVTAERTTMNHDMVYDSVQLLGTTCEEGYDLTRHCTVCGETSVEEVRGDRGPEHDTCVAVKTYDLTKYGLCGGRLQLMQCPCGERTNLYTDMDACHWSAWEYDAKLGTSVRTCNVCGLSYYLAGDKHVNEKDENCNISITDTHTFVDANGVCKLEVPYSYKQQFHDWVITSYEFRNVQEGVLPNCNDGYTYTAYCRDCKETFSGEDNSHRQAVYQTVDLKEVYGFCGGTVEQVTCPCGMLNPYTRKIDGPDCHFEIVGYDSFENADIYQCSECGLYRVERISFSPSNGQCYGYNIASVRYYIIDENNCYQTIAEISGESVPAERHTYKLQSATLTDPDAGCEGGYSANVKCIYCDKTDTVTGNYHMPVLSDIFEGNNYCTQYFYKYSCACGEQQRVEDRNQNGGMFCDFMQTEVDFETGTTVWVCSRCHSKKIDTSVKREKVGCYVYDYRKTTYYNADGTEYFDVLSKGNRGTWHVSIVGSYEFDNNGTKCTDGVTVQYVCRDCGEPIMHYGEMGDKEEPWTDYFKEHRLVNVGEYFDVSELDLDSDTFSLSKCVCGNSEDISWSGDYNPLNSTSCNMYMSFNNFAGGHTINTYRCMSGCGGSMVLDISYGAEDTASCSKPRYIDVTFTDKNNESKTFHYTDTIPAHDLTQTVKSYVENCEDGYCVQNICSRCGYQEEKYYSWHISFRKVIADLSSLDIDTKQLIQDSCACGLFGSTATYVGSNGSQGPDTNACITFSRLTWPSEPDAFGLNGLWRCNDCGALKEETYTPIGEGYQDPIAGGCMQKYNVHVVWYNVDKTKSVTADYETQRGGHNYVKEFVFAGDKDCTEGCDEYHVCTQCGDKSFVMSWNYHQVDRSKPVVFVDLAELGMCSEKYFEYQCPCGKEEECFLEGTSDSGINGTDYACHFDAPDTNGVATCRNCGGTKTEVEVSRVPNQDPVWSNYDIVTKSVTLTGTNGKTKTITVRESEYNPNR